MPSDHGRRLAELLPHASLEQISDSYTLVQIDQPRQVARIILDFLHATANRRPPREETDDRREP